MFCVLLSLLSAAASVLTLLDSLTYAMRVGGSLLYRQPCN